MNARPWDYWLLWLVAGLSLAANIWLFSGLLAARRQAGEGAALAAQAVGRLRESSIEYTVDIRQTIPISLSVPIDQSVPVPISVTLPVDTVVTVPLQTPLGDFPVNVPIRASIPIRFQTAIPLRLSVPVSATIPVRLSAHIQVAVADTQLGAALAEAQQFLDDLARQLQSSPLRPDPAGVP